MVSPESSGKEHLGLESPEGKSCQDMGKMAAKCGENQSAFSQLSHKPLAREQFTLVTQRAGVPGQHQFCAGTVLESYSSNQLGPVSLGCQTHSLSHFTRQLLSSGYQYLPVLASTSGPQNLRKFTPHLFMIEEKYKKYR